MAQTRGKGCLILLYHKIGNPPTGSRQKGLWVSKDIFYRELLFLKERHIPVVGFKEKKEGIILTFDDGYENNFSNAFPILKAFNFKAIIFLVTKYIGKYNYWHNPQNEPYIKMLSIKEIKEMKQYGIEFGSHTYSHPHLDKLKIESVKEELVKSKKMLEEIIKKKIIYFAYPYGKGIYNENIKRALKETGYQYAFTMEKGLNTYEDNFYLKRVVVPNSFKEFKKIVSPLGYYE